MHFSVKHLYRSENWRLGLVLPISAYGQSYVKEIGLQGNILSEEITSLPVKRCRALLVTARRGIGFATQAYPTLPKNKLEPGSRVIYVKSKDDSSEAWLWVPLCLYDEALREYDENYSDSLIRSRGVAPKPTVLSFECRLIIEGQIPG